MPKQSSSELGHMHLASPNGTEVWQIRALRKTIPKWMHKIKKKEKAVIATMKQQKYKTKCTHCLKQETRKPEYVGAKKQQPGNAP